MTVKQSFSKWYYIKLIAGKCNGKLIEGYDREEDLLFSTDTYEFAIGFKDVETANEYATNVCKLNNGDYIIV